MVGEMIDTKELENERVDGGKRMPGWLEPSPSDCGGLRWGFETSVCAVSRVCFGAVGGRLERDLVVFCRVIVAQLVALCDAWCPSVSRCSD